MRRSKLTRISLLLAALLIPLLVYLQTHCPRRGIAFSAGMQTFINLKNRTALPQEADFDNQVTLAALLRPGDDRGRWSEARAAAIEGYVAEIREGGIEACNCFSLIRRDTHINVTLQKSAQPREYLVVEVTPPMREWAAGQGMDWSEATLRRELVGHWCRIEGWLLFDKSHADESENTAPGGEKNWRATGWEIHPVTRLEVLR